MSSSPARLASRLPRVAAAGIVLLAAVLLSASCGRGSSSDPLDDTAPVPLDAASVCPEGHLDGAVVVCSRLHPEGAPLRLPADTATTSYGAIGRGGARFLTRTGSLPLPAAARARLVEAVDHERAAVGGDDDDLPVRTVPYAQAVYRAKFDGRVVGDLTVVVRVDEHALMTRIFGGRVLEGTIARLLGPEYGYDVDPALPIRIELEAEASGAVVRGRIVNAAGGVTMSTGVCAPGLRAAGAHDPLAPPFTERISLQRYPSMHVPFEDELVLKWNEDTTDMGAGFYPSVATLMGREPLERSWTVTPHGTPTASPALRLAFVDGGGTSCT